MEIGYNLYFGSSHIISTSTNLKAQKQMRLGSAVVLILNVYCKRDDADLLP